MAASDMFCIEVKGKGGHGAAPQGTVDAIVEAAHVVSALQTIVSRNKVIYYQIIRIFSILIVNIDNETR